MSILLDKSAKRLSSHRVCLRFLGSVRVNAAHKHVGEIDPYLVSEVEQSLILWSDCRTSL